MTRAEGYLALFDAAMSPMVSGREAAASIKRPYLEEAEKARAALMEIIAADYPDFTPGPSRKQEAEWAENRRRLKAAIGG